MAGRSVLQKVASGVSRSRAFVSHGGASAAASAPERAAPKIQGYPSRACAAHTRETFPSNRWIHGSATRNFDCSQVAAKPSSLTSRIPSVIINRVKPAKRTFSSTVFPTTEHEFAVHAKKREQEFVEWKAKLEAEHAQIAAPWTLARSALRAPGFGERRHSGCGPSGMGVKLERCSSGGPSHGDTMRSVSSHVLCRRCYSI